MSTRRGTVYNNPSSLGKRKGNEEEEEEEEEEESRLVKPKNIKFKFENVVPENFLQVLICNKKRRLTQYSNLDLMLNKEDTLEKLINKIYERTDELAEIRGAFCSQNVALTANNLLSFCGITNERVYSLNISNMYLGIPTNCNDIFDITIFQWGDTWVIKDGFRLNHYDFNELNLSEIYHIYRKKIDDELEENITPEKRELFDSILQNNIAWLTININFNMTPKGGKTRKKRFRKKRKSKNMKRRKSNK